MLLLRLTLARLTNNKLENTGLDIVGESSWTEVRSFLLGADQLLGVLAALFANAFLVHLVALCTCHGFFLPCFFVSRAILFCKVKSFGFVVIIFVITLFLGAINLVRRSGRLPIFFLRMSFFRLLLYVMLFLLVHALTMFPHPLSEGLKERELYLTHRVIIHHDVSLGSCFRTSGYWSMLFVKKNFKYKLKKLY